MRNNENKTNLKIKIQDGKIVFPQIHSVFMVLNLNNIPIEVTKLLNEIYKNILYGSCCGIYNAKDASLYIEIKNNLIYIGLYDEENETKLSTLLASSSSNEFDNPSCEIKLLISGIIDFATKIKR